MTTIILVAIGVLLAAVAALFLIFHGGDAFDGGRTRASAATLENAGLNVEAAAQGFYATNGALPSSLDDLRGAAEYGRWMDSEPSVRTAARGVSEIVEVSGVLVYRVVDVLDRDVCRRVNRDYGLGDDVVLDAVGAKPRGCYGDADGFHFFVRLGKGAAGVAELAPAPVMPLKPQNAGPANPGDVEAAAAWIRAVGGNVRHLMSRTVVDSSDSVAPYGLPAEQTSGFSAYFDGPSSFPTSVDRPYLRYVGDRQVMIMPVSTYGATQSLCRRLNVLGGGADVYGDVADAELSSRAEGCGRTGYGVGYWRRVDDAHTPIQVAAIRAVGARVEAAAARGVVSSSPAAYGVSDADVAGMGGVMDFLVEPAYNFDARSYARISVGARPLCVALETAGGGGAPLSSPTERAAVASRSFGCAQDGVVRYYFQRLDSAYVPAIVAQANAVRSEIARQTEAGRVGYGDTGYLLSFGAIGIAEERSTIETHAYYVSSEGRWYPAAYWRVRSTKACLAMGAGHPSRDGPSMGCIAGGGSQPIIWAR